MDEQPRDHSSCLSAGWTRPQDAMCESMLEIVVCIHDLFASSPPSEQSLGLPLPCEQVFTAPIALLGLTRL